MTPTIQGTLESIARILKESPNRTDNLTALILFAVLGCYESNNVAAIESISQTAYEESLAYVTIHSE